MSRLVSQEGGRVPFDFDQRLIGPEGKPVFPDQLGAGVIFDVVLAGGLFARYLEHAGEIPKRKSRAPRRVMVTVGGSFLAGSSGQQVVERYSLSRHDVPAPGRVIRLADEKKDPRVQADLAKPRQLPTVLKHGASRKDWSQGDEPWERPEAALGLGGQVMAGLLGEGCISPEQIGVDDERLLELLGAANLGDVEIQRLLRLPAHRLEVLAQSGGWRRGNPLVAEYQLGQSIVEMINRLIESL